MKIKKTTVIIILISILAAVGIGGFIWSYNQMTHYRDDSEVIAAEAAEVARKDQFEIDEEAFKEKLKEPYKEFVGPTDLGSIRFNYPLTWSAYNTINSIDSYEIVFYPGTIPPINDDTPLALKAEIINSNYEEELNDYYDIINEGQGQLEAEPITVSGDQKGILFRGHVNENYTSMFVLLKLRDKTLVIKTDTDRYISDFENIVLASLKFTP